MDSAQEGNADRPDDSNANSSANVDQSFDQKGNGPREHAKPRRRRRGKKRKQKKESAATCEADNPEDCESEVHLEVEHETHDDSEYREWDSDENLSCEAGTYNDVILRPINVPSAPLNSTQFIIDDHNDCAFYMSFETPNPYGVSSHLDSQCDVVGDVIEQNFKDAAYVDIDYQYESPQDFDNNRYYETEFEESYKNSRIEELQRLGRTELISRVDSLEARFRELSEDIMKVNPSPILEKLQAELLELQEKNSYLKEVNSKLTSVLHNEGNCSEIDKTVTESVVSSSVSHEHKSENDENEFDREVYEECGESNEIVMSDLNVDPDTPKDICTEKFDSQISQSEIADTKLVRHTEVSDQFIDQNEVNKDCCVSSEVVMSNLNAKPDTLKDICEGKCDSQVITKERLISHNEVRDQLTGFSEVNKDDYVSNEVVMSNLESDTLKDMCEEKRHVKIIRNVEQYSVKTFKEYGHSKIEDHCTDLHEVSKDHCVDHSEVDGRHQMTDVDDIEATSECQIKCGDVSDQPIDHSEVDSILQDSIDSRNVVSDNIISQPGSVCRDTTTANSEGLQTKHIHCNSRKMLHCQPNNLVNDDLRTLNISSSDLFHITNQTKCSSLVPVEGGMSPSETSVN